MSIDLILGLLVICGVIVVAITTFVMVVLLGKFIRGDLDTWN